MWRLGEYKIRPYGAEMAVSKASASVGANLVFARQAFKDCKGVLKPGELERSSLRSQLIGIMECWNNGIMGLEDWGNGKMVFRIPM